MTAVAARQRSRNHGHPVRDAATVTRRNLIRFMRQPQVIVFAIIQPVMFVLLFTYVFGGAIDLPGVDNYIDFLLPGVIVQTTAFGAAGAAIAMADDMDKGIIDRFRALPMARSAVIAGRTLADAARTVLTVIIMVVVGFLVGFRFHGGLLGFLGAIGVAVVFGWVMSWIAVWIGLSVKSPEAAQGAGFVWLFPLTFASSAFVDPRVMPDWLRSFADVNPITYVSDSVRALALGPDLSAQFGLELGASLIGAALWMAAIVTVFGYLAVRVYRRAA